MTVPVFPLFNQLYEECLKNPDKYKFDNKIKMTISTLPNNKKNIVETIYYIIHHYYILDSYQNTYMNYKSSNTMVSEDDIWKHTILSSEPTRSSRSRKTLIYLVEYGGKTFENGNGIIYSNDMNFPPFLKQMISAYITIISN